MKEILHIYSRVSTRSQLDGDSIKVQKGQFLSALTFLFSLLFDDCKLLSVNETITISVGFSKGLGKLLLKLLLDSLKLFFDHGEGGLHGLCFHKRHNLVFFDFTVFVDIHVAELFDHLGLGFLWKRNVSG